VDNAAEHSFYPLHLVDWLVTLETMSPGAGLMTLSLVAAVAKKESMEPLMRLKCRLGGKNRRGVTELILLWATLLVVNSAAKFLSRLLPLPSACLPCSCHASGEMMVMSMGGLIVSFVPLMGESNVSSCDPFSCYSNVACGIPSMLARLHRLSKSVVA
jgi:hypothetical protein